MSPISHDSLIYARQLIHICHTTNSHIIIHTAYSHVTQPIHVCHTTHLHMLHNLYTYVTHSYIPPKMREITLWPCTNLSISEFGRAASGGASVPEPAARHRGQTRVSTDLASFHPRIFLFFLRSDFTFHFYVEIGHLFHFFLRLDIIFHFILSSDIIFFPGSRRNCDILHHTVTRCNTATHCTTHQSRKWCQCMYSKLKEELLLLFPLFWWFVMINTRNITVHD